MRLAVYKDDKHVLGYQAVGEDGDVSTCGYSPIAIVFSIILGSLITLITIGGSLKRMEPATPLVGTCSAVVSAACHGPAADEYAALGKLKWGVLSDNNEWGWNHCCITSWGVEKPQLGRWYE